MVPQPPPSAATHLPILHSIAEGLRFVVRTPALAGSCLVDLVAMTFGWPRAMLAVLSLTVLHAGARGTGLLFAALALGGTLSVLSAAGSSTPGTWAQSPWESWWSWDWRSPESGSAVH